MKKKLLFIIILFGVILIPRKTFAANYGIRELMPIDLKNTLVTRNFSYKEYSYNKLNGDDKISFKGIKNLTDEEKPITFSIGLFGKDKKNIGTVNYCGRKKNKFLKSKEEESFSITIDISYISKDNVLDDVYYIAMLGDNIGCNEEGSLNFVGQNVEEIGYAKNTTLSDDAERMIKVFAVVGAVLVGLFLYRFLFTTAYQNVDGDDVRRGFEKLNKDLKREREYEERVHPKPPKEIKKTKTDEVLEQEEKAKNEDKDNTDLHNFYK